MCVDDNEFLPYITLAVDETISAIVLDGRTTVPSTTRLQNEMATPSIGERRVDSVGSKLRTNRTTLPTFG